MLELDEVTGAVVDASVHIHRDLGPGLLESVYETILAHVLRKRGIRVEQQKALGFEYEGLVFHNGVVNNLSPSASPRLRVNTPRRRVNQSLN
jgi:GxxExxY protein